MCRKSDQRTFAVIGVIAAAVLLLPAKSSAQELTPAIHVGGAYSTHVEDIGAMIGAYIALVNQIKFGGEFTYYFTDDVGAADFTLWTINLNGRYPLLTAVGGPRIDALAGVNITHWKGNYDFGLGFGFGKNQGVEVLSESATDFGINLGGVVEYSLGSVDLFGKAHAVLGGDSSGFVVGAGLSKSFGG